MTDSSVVPNAVPAGMRSWKNNSGRSDSGKNCCWTWPKATIDNTKMPTVASTTVTRQLTHHSMTRRSAAIHPGFVDLVRIVAGREFLEIRQELHADIRREHDGDDPRCQ